MLNPARSDVTEDALTFTAANGHPIRVTRFRGTHETSSRGASPRGAIIISAAMATEARFYRPLAKWFAGQGFDAYTFDYQQYGSSLLEGSTLRNASPGMFDWASDARTVLDRVHEMVQATATPGAPIHWIGHSLGGQLLAFTDTAKLTSATVVASGSGHWRLMDPPGRWFTPAIWYVVAPLVTRLKGFFPGRKLRVLGDLPASIIREWGAWCKHREYLIGEHPEHRATYANVRVPITSITFTDDETMSDTGSAELRKWYSGAPFTSWRVTPQEVGVQRIGHMGFCRPAQSAAWPQLFSHLVSA